MCVVFISPYVSVGTFPLKSPRRFGKDKITALDLDAGEGRETLEDIAVLIEKM